MFVNIENNTSKNGDFFLTLYYTWTHCTKHTNYAILHSHDSKINRETCSDLTSKLRPRSKGKNCYSITDFIILQIIKSDTAILLKCVITIAAQFQWSSEYISTTTTLTHQHLRTTKPLSFYQHWKNNLDFKNQYMLFHQAYILFTAYQTKLIEKLNFLIYQISHYLVKCISIVKLPYWSQYNRVVWTWMYKIDVPT